MLLCNLALDFSAPGSGISLVSFLICVSKFWINVSIGAGLAIIVAASAPIVAWFYGDERLVAITAALACCWVT